MQNQSRTPTMQPLAMQMEPLAKATPGAALRAAVLLGQSLRDAEENRKTEEELEAARTAPENSPRATLAESRRKFLRTQIGPSIVGFECVGEQLFAKRFSFGETLYLTLLAPLDEFGFLDATQPDKLAFLMAEMLRLGLCRDAHATPYFENRGDSVAFVDSDATADFASISIMAIDRLSNLLPKRAEVAQAPPEAPKSRSQKRLKKMRAKAEEAPAETPEPASETPNPTQDTQPETTQ
jgi:hypothetical protein